MFNVFEIGNICFTTGISNPTPVYVVQAGGAVIQCGLESKNLSWQL